MRRRERRRREEQMRMLKMFLLGMSVGVPAGILIMEERLR